MDPLILGLSLGHDVSAALISGGRVLAAVQEERITKIKQHPGFPLASVREVLDLAGVTPRDINAVAIGWDREFLYEVYDPIREGFRYLDRDTLPEWLNRQILEYLLQPETQISAKSRQAEQMVRNYLSFLDLGKAAVWFVGHHRAHAASAYYPCPWEEALVITSDGKGGGLSATISHARGDLIKQVGATPDLDSIGYFYGAITRYLGYRSNRHEGKITGLAAFGDSRANLAACGDIIQFEPATRNIINRLNLKSCMPNETARIDRELARFFSLKEAGTIKGILDSEGDQRRFRLGYVLLKNYLDQHLASPAPADIAAFAQDLLERNVLAQIKDARRECPAPYYICLAGGVFANVKLNQRVRELEGVENVFIYPAMGDGGTAVGAALEVAFNHLQEKPPRAAIDTVYHGRGYDHREIEKTLQQQAAVYVFVPEIEKETARLIHQGKIVGHFHGGMEWGPRALGNRSILARATGRAINEELNQRLRRTEFMPFAPSIRAEDAGEYFQGYRADHLAANFMTITYDVFPEKARLCPAVVHIDNTARPQVVRAQDNPRYHRIISEYQRLSGLPIIINTSFNMHEAPIVRSPADALRSFAEGAVDVLVLGNFLVRQTSSNQNSLQSRGTRINALKVV